MTTGTHANGIGCLAAQTVANFKDRHGVGMIYLEPTDCNYYAPYVYKVLASPFKPLKIQIFNYNNKKIFSGTPQRLILRGRGGWLRCHSGSVLLSLLLSL